MSSGTMLYGVVHMNAPGITDSQMNGSSSLTIYIFKDRERAEKYAKANAAAGAYVEYIFTLDSIVRRKPVPVEVEKVSACEEI